MKSFTWTSKQASKQASKSCGAKLPNPSILGTLKGSRFPKGMLFHFHMQQKLEIGKRQNNG
jgi:hypothetical protein